MRRDKLPLWLILLLMLCLPPLAGQQKRYAGPPHFRAFQEYERNGALTRVVLRNGLTIIIEEHPSLPLAAITTCITNQGLDAKQLAASSLLGIAYRRSLELSGEAFGLGAVFTASVGPEASIYNLTLP